MLNNPMISPMLRRGGQSAPIVGRASGLPGAPGATLSPAQQAVQAQAHAASRAQAPAPQIQPMKLGAPGGMAAPRVETQPMPAPQGGKGASFGGAMGAAQQRLQPGGKNLRGNVPSFRPRQ